MSVTSAQLESLRRFIGQGEVYYDVNTPASDFDPILFVAGSPGVPQISSGATAAPSVGLTSGPASLEYKPEFKGVEVEQANGEVAPRLTKESVTLKFKMAEATYDRLKLALQTATLTTTTGSGVTPTTRLLSMGGQTFFPTQCIALVSPIGTYTDSSTVVELFEWVALYQALSVDGVKLDYKRNETRMVEVTITGYADVTRGVGDQLFQIGQDEDPTP